ncbi:MAG TPA: TauD/TfdA family dioxygenase, partial [Pseudomonadaceae bacterium]|nr:TauD/TfdA family dioxygenase [Pseudomonadaceae bacterium]
MNLKMKHLKPRIGVEIETDVDVLLSGKATDRIRALLEERGVILFRDMEMSDEQQVAFSKTLGTIESAKSGEVYKVSQDK